MGLLGGSTVVVSSSAYNMAGDFTKRPNFLKSAVTGNIITSSKFSMSETITGSYMNGPGIKARQFMNWASNHYGGIGVPQANLGHVPIIDKAAVQNEIPHGSGQYVDIQEVKTALGDLSFWAEQWIMANVPEKLLDGWTWTYDDPSNTLTIHWSDSTTTSLNPVNYDPDGKYFYTVYLLKTSTEVLGSRIWIYKLGDGNAVMDAIPTLETHPNAFMPAIPIRINNNFLSGSYMPDAYDLAKRAYKKATSQRLDDLVKKLTDNNTNLNDVDHIYMVYGVSLNTQDRTSKKYIYNFFKYLTGRLPYATGDYSLWRSGPLATFETNDTNYNNSRTSAWGDLTPPMPDDGLPTEGSDPALSHPAPFYPAKNQYQVEIKSYGSLVDDINRFHMIVDWVGIEETTGTGLYKLDATFDSLWFDIIATDDNFKNSLHYAGYYMEYDQIKDDVVDLVWQVDLNNWKKLRIYGLQHKNLVYKDKAVVISATDALNDTDESGFIVPIHYETMRAMSLVNSTQLMTSSSYLVMNSYQIVKQKWYQTGLFKIALFVAVIAITVATGGAGGVGAVGILGTAGSVGAALGFAGLAAVIVGAVVNAIAAMIIMALIQKVSTAVFGAKVGAFIAAIASVVAMAVGGSIMSGQSMASMWGNLMSAQGIMGMTSAVGNGVAGYIQASAAEWNVKDQSMMDQFHKEQAKYTQMYIDQFGANGTFSFDTNRLTDNFQDSEQMVGVETLDTFLQRTLMSGSDIAEMTMDMLSNFAGLTTNLDTSFGG